MDSGFRSHEGWANAYRRKRDGQINFIGSKEEPMGNQNCQLSYERERDCFSLRVRKDLEFMEHEKDKFFVISGLQFSLHREQLIRAIQERCTPFTFRFLRRGRKWYLQVIFTWVMEERDRISDVSCGVIGLDFNDGFLSFSETDEYGNLIGLRHFPLDCHGMGKKAESEMQETIAKIVRLAKEKRKPIAVEQLDFKKTKALTTKARGSYGKQYNKMVHALDYSRYKTCLENVGFREMEDPYQLHFPDSKLGEMDVKTGWGATKQWPEGFPGAFPVHDEAHIVCKDVADWKDYVKAPPAVFPEEDWAQAIAHAESVDRKDKFVTAFIAPGLFEQCHYLLEIQNCLMSFYEEPEAMKELINYIADWEVEYAKQICKYMKPDALFHHDDWGT